MSYMVSIHGVTDEAVCVQGLSPLSKCPECNVLWEKLSK